MKAPPRCRRATILLSLLVACGLRAQTPSAQDHSFVVQLDWEVGSVGTNGARRVPLVTEPPAGVKLPTGMANAGFARIELAEGDGLALALDANDGGARLWVDCDLDGDLSNETPVRFAPASNLRTQSKTVLLRYSGQAEPTPVALQFGYSRSGTRDFLNVRLEAHRRGSAVLGGRVRLVALVDGNQDARFDDPASDRVYVDLNGNGELEAGGQEPPELVRIGEAFRVGDEGWQVEPPGPAGRALSFVRAKSVPPARLREWPQSYVRTPGAERRPPQESLDDLLARFQDERGKPYGQRYQTISRIGDIGTAKAFDALLKIVDDEDQIAIQTAVLRALGNPACLADRGDKLAQLARKASAKDAAGFAEALFLMGHPDRDAIYLQLIKSSDAQVISGVARWLALSESADARAALCRVVREHAAPAARYGAYVQGVRNFDGGPPIEIALHAAADDYVMLRARAIQDLGLLGHEQAVELALAAAAERPVDRTLGTALAEVLGADGGPRAVTAMLGLLDDEKLHADVRKQVVEQLRLVRAPASVAVVVKALQAKVAAVRASAVEVLADIPEASVTAALLKCAKKEKDDQVLAAFCEALGDHGDQQALTFLLKYARASKQPEVRSAAVRGLARLGFHLPKVRQFFLGMLDSRDWVDRVLALDAAAAVGDPSLGKKVLASLAHQQWQVRLAAVETLDRLRLRDAVQPLIERLDEDGEQEQRIRDAIAGALFRLTGVNVPDDGKVWRLWWSENGATFEVPAEIPTMPDRRGDGTASGFFGIPVTSERVVFVLDQSGSMSAPGFVSDDYREKQLNRLEVAVRETLGALGKLRDGARVNVIMFHTTISPWEDELQRLKPNRKKLEQHLERQRPMGGTNIYDGLELALRMKDVDTIFLLSDGVPGAGRYIATDDILRAVRRENQTRRIAINCVAVGVDSELLRKLALENGGRYVRR